MQCPLIDLSGISGCPPRWGINLAGCPVKICVVVPVFNTPPHLLERCLTSLADQRKGLSNALLETIIVDDCSNVLETIGAIDQAIQANPGFLLIRNNFNMGLAYSRALGAEKASGDYVFFVDSDDTLPPLTLFRLAQVAKSTGADVVDGYIRRIEDGETRWHRSLDNEDLEAQRRNTLRADTSFMMQGSLYSVEVIIQSKLRVPHRYPHEDMTTRVRALFTATSYAQVPACTYNYHIQPISLSIFSGLRNVEGVLAAAEDWVEVMKQKGVTENYQEDMRVGVRKLLGGAIKRINRVGGMSVEDVELISERLISHEIPHQFFSEEELDTLISALQPPR